MGTLRPCNDADFEEIHAVINDGAMRYRGVIPADRWHEPYMEQAELRHEIGAGVRFWGYGADRTLVGVMGVQPVRDVVLIRHAYVRAADQGQGIGGRLLARVCAETTDPILVGTWAAAAWAVTFYQRHGFQLVPTHAKTRLLKCYWSIPKRQNETSVVLANDAWFDPTR